MGLHKPLTPKDERIKFLEAQLLAHEARTSGIQQRLLQILDTLDVLQVSSRKEAAAKERLIEKLDRYAGYVKAAESEKDDMRDAVLQLVEKVESSNDVDLQFKQWPYSRIRISNLVDSLTPPTTYEQSRPDDDLIYAKALLSTIHTALIAEREAHADTRNISTVLRAQLARREAELERCICHCTGQGYSHHQETDYERAKFASRTDEPMPEGGGSRRSNRERVVPSLTQEEIIATLGNTSKRNKTLEAEIKALFRRLEQARRSSKRETVSEDASRRSCLFDTAFLAGSTPKAVPLDSATFDPPPRSRSEIEPSHGPPSISGDAAHPRTGSPTTSLTSQVLPLLLHLESQIADLGAKVDTFKQERDRLAHTVHEQLTASQSPSSSFRPPQVISDANNLNDGALDIDGTRAHVPLHSALKLHEDSAVHNQEAEQRVDPVTLSPLSSWKSPLSLPYPPSSPSPSLHPLRSDRSTTPTLLSLSSLAKDISDLGAKVYAFQEERGRFADVILQDGVRQEARSRGSIKSQSIMDPVLQQSEIQVHVLSPPPLIDPRVQTMEEECLKLRNSNQALLERLEGAASREQELMEKIRQLSHPGNQEPTMNSPSAEPTLRAQEAADPKLNEEPVDLLEPLAYEGEMSMELATPLNPTTFLPLSPHVCIPSRPGSKPQPRSPRSKFSVASLLPTSPGTV